MSKIAKVEVFTCKEPLKTPFTHATSGHIDHLDGVFVKITTDDGYQGFGEVRGNCSYFTGGITPSVTAVIMKELAPSFIGEDPTNMNRLHNILENKIVGNYAAKAACDCALYDLNGKILGLPVYQLLGGKLRDFMESEENIPFMEPEQAAQTTQELIEHGCNFIKVRVGAPNFSYDLSRVAAIWKVIKASGKADKITFSMDANQAWEIHDAVHKINKLTEYGITIVEQPAKYLSPARLRQLKQSCPVKLFGDEAVGTIEELVRYIELEVIDGIHIKLIKCGGIYNAINLMRIAEAHDIQYMIGGMDEGMLAVTAAVHCAAVAKTELFELKGHIRIEDGGDPSHGLEIRGGDVYVPHTPGLGITIDENKLKKMS